MSFGQKPGEKGHEISRLHRLLHAVGLEVADDEAREQSFGASTLAALHALLRRRGLPIVDEINERTPRVLLELEQSFSLVNVTINEGGGGTQPAPKPDPFGHVTGTVVDGDGHPIAGLRISVYEKQLRSEAKLGEARTDEQGQYAIQYPRPAPLTLVVRATADAGNVVASAGPVFAAPERATLDLTTAPDGVVRQPSRFTTLKAQVTAQLRGTPLADLRENKDEHELSFVAGAVGAPFADVAYLFMGDVLGTKHGLQAETLFGIFQARIPAPLAAALGSLPDGGIDDAFMGQALGGLLAHAREVLKRALDASVEGDVLPASYADGRDRELDRLDALREESTSRTPYLRGKTALADLLAAGSLSATVQSAFVSAFAASGRRIGQTWKVLRANKDLPPADLAALKTTLSTGELLAGNLPLVRDTLQRLSASSLRSIQELAALDESEWIQRVTAIDPDATGIPPVLPDETPAQRISRFSKALAARFERRYPSMAFAGGLAKAGVSSFKSKTEIVALLAQHPALRLERTNLDQYIATKKVEISAPALAELKTAQRLLRIAPRYTSVEALKSAGYESAQAVYFSGRGPFVAQMSAPLGGDAAANAAFAQAKTTYATALTLFGRFGLALNGVGTAAMASAAPDPGTIADFPDLQSLFGSLDYFDCEDCQSIHSPAAYLVDLLQYLKQFRATPLPGAPPIVGTIADAHHSNLS